MSNKASAPGAQRQHACQQNISAADDVSNTSAFDYKAEEHIEHYTTLILARDAIRQEMGKCAKSIIKIGINLIRAKKECGYGLFLKWLTAEFGWSQRTAYNFMSVAERFGEEDLQRIANLEPTTLYLLAAPKTPDQVREEVLTRFDAGKKISAEEIKGILRQSKGEPNRRPDRTTVNNPAQETAASADDPDEPPLPFDDPTQPAEAADPDPAAEEPSTVTEAPSEPEPVASADHSEPEQTGQTGAKPTYYVEKFDDNHWALRRTDRPDVSHWMLTKTKREVQEWADRWNQRDAELAETIVAEGSTEDGAPSEPQPVAPADHAEPAQAPQRTSIIIERPDNDLILWRYVLSEITDPVKVARLKDLVMMTWAETQQNAFAKALAERRIEAAEESSNAPAVAAAPAALDHVDHKPEQTTELEQVAETVEAGQAADGAVDVAPAEQTSSSDPIEPAAEVDATAKMAIAFDGDQELTEEEARALRMFQDQAASGGSPFIGMFDDRWSKHEDAIESLIAKNLLVPHPDSDRNWMAA